MPFKVTHERWLATETDRVVSLILMPRWWHRAWTPQSLKEALSDIGLHYSLPEIQEINDELHKRNVVTDVSEK